MRVRRGDLYDVYEDGGRAAVMVAEQVLVLSELATAIVAAVPESGSVSLEEVAARVGAELGAPDPPHSALELVRGQVEELAAHQVLVPDEPLAPAASTPEAVAALRDAVRHLLTGTAGVWTLPPAIAPALFVAAARQHHLEPFLHLHRARLALPHGAAAAIHAVAAQRAAAVEVLSDDLGVALGALDRAGVRVLVIKGLALAVQAHGDARARGAGDLDLLVAPEEVAAAHEALVRAGWDHDPTYPAPGPSWAWRHLFRTGYELSMHGARSMIDLHWHLSPSPSTFPAFDVLWSRRSTVEIGPREVATLSPYDALAHSAGHAAKDQWRWLRSLVDVHRLASDTDTWRQADRPLRADQLLSVGLAARMFGVLTGAPPVVHDAVARAAGVWEGVLDTQAGTAETHSWHEATGTALRNSSAQRRLTKAGTVDAARVLGFSLLPPWAIAEETSRHAHAAVPRAMWRRVQHLRQRPGREA